MSKFVAYISIAFCLTVNCYSQEDSTEITEPEVPQLEISEPEIPQSTNNNSQKNRYEVKLSANLYCSQSKINFIESSFSDQYWLGYSHFNTSNFLAVIKSLPGLTSETAIDIELPFCLKLTSGLSFNQIRFETPEIVYRSMSYPVPPWNGSSTYPSKSTFIDEITINSCQVFLGFGLAKKVKKIVYDFDISVRGLSFNIDVYRKFKGNAEPFPYPTSFSLEPEENKWIPKMFSIGFKSSISYRFYKNFYLNIAAFSYRSFYFSDSYTSKILNEKPKITGGYAPYFTVDFDFSKVRSYSIGTGFTYCFK